MPIPVTTRRFTVAEYYRMAEAGILGPAERVELIEGEVVRMAAIGSRHAGCVNRLARLLVRGVGDRAVVAVQNPVRLDDLSEPEPDLALLRARGDDYADAHPGPGDVLLVVEVAETTLDFDRDTKGPLYARAGIVEYWVVDLVGDLVQVYRNPADRGYLEARAHRRGDVLRTAALEELELPVVDILP